MTDQDKKKHIMEPSKDNDNTSHVSSRSSTRMCASSASAAAKARAKAEAARVRLSFAEKEAKLKLELAEREAKQKAEDARVVLEKVKLDAELQTLALQREAAAASRQAEVLEAAEEQVKAPHNTHSSAGSVKSEMEDRTSAYVRSQNELYVPLRRDDVGSPPRQCNETLVTWGTPTGLPEISTSARNAAILHEVPVQPPGLTSSASLFPFKGTDHNEQELRSKPQLHNMAHSAQAYTPHRHTYRNMTPSGQQYTSHHHTYHKMDPLARSYVPHQYTDPADQLKAPVMTDFVKYLARRELVTTGLIQFDDRPESFRAWQSSFHNAIRGLSLSASEELDLLTKWLGKESSCHVRTIRQVYVNDPDAALSHAWNRLIKL